MNVFKEKDCFVYSGKRKLMLDFFLKRKKGLPNQIIANVPISRANLYLILHEMVEKKIIFKIKLKITGWQQRYSFEINANLNELNNIKLKEGDIIKV